MTALSSVQRRYFDAVSGQAGYYGTVKKDDETSVVTVRVRVENRELTEAKWYIARANDPGMRGPREPGGSPANLHNPEYLEQHAAETSVACEPAFLTRASELAS